MEIDWNTIAAAAGIATALGGAALAVEALLLARQTEKRLQAARELLKENRKIWLDIQDFWINIQKFYRNAQDFRNEMLYFLHQAKSQNPHLCLALDCVHHSESEISCDKSDPIIDSNALCKSYSSRPTNPKED